MIFHFNCDHFLFQVTARRPFGKDNDRFDYDYDSDDDWEEEEQGESLSDEEKDMEEDEKEAEKDADADQEDDGFFVGHGVLDKDEVNGGSDCEMDMDDELEIKKQKLKAQQFEDEYKKKKPAKLKPRIFGCFWNDPGKILKYLNRKTTQYAHINLNRIVSTCNKTI